MNTNDLEAFLAVIETGSIMAAAARLNLTQPGVTRRVQNLEEQLGVALFERPGKPLKPTLAGREAYENGRRVLQSIEDLKSGAAPNGAIRGELRLGVSLDLSEAALATPLDRLREHFPDLTLRLTSGWSPLLVEQVARNQIDAASISLPEAEQPPEELEAEVIGRQRVIIVAAKDSDLPDEAPLAALARKPWVVSQYGCGYRTTLRRRFEAEGLHFNVGVEALSTELRLSCVARGLGLSLVSPEKLAASPSRDRLREIAIPGFAPKVRAWVVNRRATGRLKRPITTFREALAEEMRANAAAVS